MVTGAFLGLGGYAIKDGGVIQLAGISVSIAAIVVFSAVFPLFAFYFMDRFWDHRLLDGAVAAGKEAEAELKALGYKVDLGTKISVASPFEMWFFRRRNVRSGNKMDLFYCVLLTWLLAVAMILGFGVHPQTVTVLPAIARLPAGLPEAATPPVRAATPVVPFEIK